tara:strand:+ start:993 stop:1796 length:804 start_codon:yes stop_codon:yes gene_type:complete
MAITRLQQARQMFRYGGDTMGGPNDKSNDSSGNGGAVDTGDLGTEEANVAANVSANMSPRDRDRARSEMYKNMPKPTITVGVDKFDNPINVPTTYTARRDRQKTIDALNQKGISIFDPRVTKTLNPFDMSFVAQPKQKQFGLLDLALIAATGGLFGGKIAAGAKMFNTAKNVSKLAQTIGLTDKNVINSFIDNLTNKTSTLSFDKTKTKTTKNEDDNRNRGENGLGSLENMDALNQEYLLLLDKFNSGVFSDADQVRFTFLKKILKK